MTVLDIFVIALFVIGVGTAGYFFIKKKGVSALIDVPSLLEKAVTELEGHLKELDGNTIWERKLLLILDRINDKSPILQKAITQLREGKARYAVGNFRKAIDEMRGKNDNPSVLKVDKPSSSVKPTGYAGQFIGSIPEGISTKKIKNLIEKEETKAKD